jgi:uncharacterized membrane protein
MNFAQYQSSYLSKSKRNFFVFIAHAGFFYALYSIVTTGFRQTGYFYLLLLVYTLTVVQHYWYKYKNYNG